ncbi:MAG: M14 family metallopeptidase [Actinomycetota bacterium]|nr:M14 family metallopeptidase [Actinomycetota bacterium]
MIGKRKPFSRLWVVLVISGLLLMLALCPASIAQEEDEGSNDIRTGPIDPAAGSWVLYRGERTLPDQPNPQAFFVRVTYNFAPEIPQDGILLQADVEELDTEQRTVSLQSYTLQTKDRLYHNQEGQMLGFWPYWVPARPGIDDEITVEDEINLIVEEESEYDFRENKYTTELMRGEGIEVLAEKRTGLVFRMQRENGEKLEIEDTNMLAQYPLWGYYPDDVEVGERLESLAESYPDLMEASSLGKSMRGRDIWLAHLADFTSTEKKRSILLTAALEGNAPEGSDFLLDLLDELGERAQEDDEFAELLKRLDIYVVPLVNPDGLQRWLAMPDPAESAVFKNQAPRNGNLVFLNHNFDIQWQDGDKNPASAGYAGKEAFSETESQAIRDLLDDTPVSLYVNLQTGTNSLLAPWNWKTNSGSNPEKSLYESILSELTEIFPYPTRVGIPANPFPGSATDWAYEGNGASSPLCFNLGLARVPIEGEDGEESETDLSKLEDRGSLEVYSPQKEALYHLMDNLHSYLDVDIITGEPRAEVNVPLDLDVEIVVSGMRALPNAQARLVLTNGSGLKLATLSEKDMSLGNLQPGSTYTVSWELEGKTSGTYIVEVIISSSYPDYENIPGTYSIQFEIVISSQRTWLVLVLLSILVLFLLSLVFLSMRKHQKRTGQPPT